MMMVTLVLGTTYFCGLNSTITILEEDVVLIRLYGESCHCYVEFEGNKLDKKPTVYNEDRKDCHWSCTCKLCGRCLNTHNYNFDNIKTIHCLPNLKGSKEELRTYKFSMKLKQVSVQFANKWDLDAKS